MYNNKIKQYRIERGLTTKEAAEMTGISMGYWSHLEKGNRKNPSKEVMANIAKVLNKSVIEIFFTD